MGLIPGRGMKIPHAAWPKKKRKKESGARVGGRGRAVHGCYTLVPYSEAGGPLPRAAPPEAQFSSQRSASAKIPPPCPLQTPHDRQARTEVRSCTLRAQLLCLSQARKRCCGSGVGLSADPIAPMGAQISGPAEGHTLSGWAGRFLELRAPS